MLMFHLSILADDAEYGYHSASSSSGQSHGSPKGDLLNIVRHPINQLVQFREAFPQHQGTLQPYQDQPQRIQYQPQSEHPGKLKSLQPLD